MRIQRLYQSIGRKQVSRVFTLLMLATLTTSSIGAIDRQNFSPIQVSAVESIIATPLNIKTTVYGHEGAVIARFDRSRLYSASSTDALPKIVVETVPIRSPYLRAQSVLDEGGLDVLTDGLVPIPTVRPAVAVAVRTAALVPPDVVLSDTAPRISLVVTTLGFDARATSEAIETLPPSVTFAFVPVVQGVAQWEKRARQRGHTTLLEIPMEPMNYPAVNPGDLTLLTQASAQDNITRLEQALAMAPNVSGVTNYLGARFTAESTAIEPMLGAVKEKGYFLFENTPTARSQMQSVAKTLGVPYMRGHYTISATTDVARLQNDLDFLVRIAQEKGHAVGVVALEGRVVLPQLQNWIDTLPEQGVRLTSLK